MGFLWQGFGSGVGAALQDGFFEERLGAASTITQKFTRALLAGTFWYFKTFLRCGQLLKCVLI